MNLFFFSSLFSVRCSFVTEKKMFFIQKFFSGPFPPHMHSNKKNNNNYMYLPIAWNIWTFRYFWKYNDICIVRHIFIWRLKFVDSYNLSSSTNKDEWNCKNVPFFLLFNFLFVSFVLLFGSSITVERCGMALNSI